MFRDVSCDARRTGLGTHLCAMTLSRLRILGLLDFGDGADFLGGGAGAASVVAVAWMP